MSRAGILDRLHALIESRGRERPTGSYVVQLLDGGLEAIAGKIREESEEVIEAATQGSAELASELADLLFHTWVLMVRQGVSPAEVYAVLEARFGTGGLEEKAARSRESSDAG